jgi:murein L,D-transpeptidase YafK
MPGWYRTTKMVLWKHEQEAHRHAPNVGGSALLFIPFWWLREEMKSKVIFLLLAIIIFCWFESPKAKSPPEEPADRMLIEKAARKLTLYRGQNVIRTYRVALGSQPTGKKQCQGDKRTPEGRYIIDGRNKGSRYHRSLRISYPNAADRDAAKRLRCNPGGDIMIHGLTNGYGWVGKLHTTVDWTLGCIAVTNQEIEEIWNLVPNGTPIVIHP